MDDTVGPMDRRPQPGACMDGGGHFDPKVYRFGPPDRPASICLAHLIGRIKRATWPDPPRTLGGV